MGPADVTEAHLVQVGDEVSSTAGKYPASQVSLHRHHADVDFLPGDGLQYWQLCAFYVETEVVDGGVAECQEETVEWQALHLDGLTVLLQHQAGHRLPAALIADGAPEVEPHGLRPGVGGEAGLGSPGLPVGPQSFVIAERMRLHQETGPVVLHLEVKTVAVGLKVVSPGLDEESVLQFSSINNLVNLERLANLALNCLSHYNHGIISLEGALEN